MSLHVTVGEGGVWRPLGALQEGDVPGSMSNNAEGRRDVISFRCEGDYSVIERSVAGADVEAGDLRAITTTGFEQLARLVPGESFEMPVQTDRMAEPVRLRFTHN